MTAMEINGKGYVGMGHNAINNTDFWEYTPAVIGVEEVAMVKEISMAIYPNPVSTNAIIKVSETLKNGRLIIFNLMGDIVNQQDHISGNEIKIDAINLENGIYFVRIIENNLVLANEKIVVKL